MQSVFVVFVLVVKCEIIGVIYVLPLSMIIILCMFLSFACVCVPGETAPSSGGTHVTPALC